MANPKKYKAKKLPAKATAHEPEEAKSSKKRDLKGVIHKWTPSEFKEFQRNTKWFESMDPVLTTGEVIKMLRKLKGWTRKELAKRCKIPAANIGLLETNKMEIGKKMAEHLAHAFNVHPATIMFPEYESRGDMLPEYDFSKGIRGKHAGRCMEGSNG
jgi:ribosome-binding protein aMBF1 (putative translation factor)